MSTRTLSRRARQDVRADVASLQDSSTTGASRGVSQEAHWDEAVGRVAALDLLHAALP